MNTQRGDSVAASDRLVAITEAVATAATAVELPFASVAPRLAQLADTTYIGDSTITVTAHAGAATALGDRPRTPPQPQTDGESLGHLYETLLSPELRRQLGVFFTPPTIAQRLIALADDGWQSRPKGPARVLDPSCGAGAFLVAAAVHQVGQGADPLEAVDHLTGVDVDPLAVALCEAVVRLWLAGCGVDPAATIGPQLYVGDYLGEPPTIPDAGTPRFDLVVGNPPFLNQLGGRTVRSRRAAASLRDRFGPVAGGYVDTAALFLLAAIDDAVPGGRVALLQPASVLATAGAAPVRAALLERGGLTALWDADSSLFDASVQVCAPVIEKGATTTEVVRRSRAEFTTLPSVPWPDPPPASWAMLAVQADRVPQVELGDGPTLVSMATATAGFRDQFYGLAPHVVDVASDVGGAVGPDPGNVNRPRLVTSGLIDPLRLRWGERMVKLAGTKYAVAAVDMASLLANPEMHRWVSARLRPKVLLATQTRVLECVPDIDGVLVPSTPVVSVECARNDVYRVAALLTAPPVTAWAVRNFGGSALTRDAVKLSAKQVLTIPLPTHPEPWQQAADLVAQLPLHTGDEAVEDNRQGQLRRIGTEMCRAFGLTPDHPVLAWWLDRLTTRERTAPR